MKMYALLLLLLLLLCGCGGNDEGEHEPEQTVDLFQPNKGLTLPEEVKQSLGVALVEVAETNSVITIPISAVIEGAQETFVYVESGDYLVRTPIKPGTAVNGMVEITDGLLAGDRVVANAAKDLWMIELLAVRGGTPCCVIPKKRA